MNAALCVYDEGLWDGTETPEGLHQITIPHQQGVVHFFSAMKAFDGPETLVQRNAHKDNISVLISFGQFLEVRDFGTTRWAPGRPEVEHLNLAFELVGMRFTGFEIDQLPLRRPLADLGVAGEDGRESALLPTEFTAFTVN